MQILDDRRLQAIAAQRDFVDLDVGQALGAVDRDELGVGVDLGTRHGGAARHPQTDHAAAFHVGRAGKYLEIDILHHRGQVGEFELDAHIRLVGAVHRHRGGVIHHRKRIGQFDVQAVLEHQPDHAFEHVADFLLAQERGLAVDLGKFRLAVGAQIFVAEAFGNLVVAVEVGHHQQLFEQLRRLRQREEFAGIHARRYQVIARAFRRGLGQHRRFDIDEAEFVEELAHFHRHLVAQAQIVLHLRTAQIQHAVRQAGGLRQVVVIHLERRRNRRVQHFQRIAYHFDLAGIEVVVDGAVRTVAHHAGGAQAELVAHMFGCLEHLGLLRIADDLHQALAVAQIDENDAAVVAATMHPAAQADGLAEQSLGSEAAVVGSHGHCLTLSVSIFGVRLFGTS